MTLHSVLILSMLLFSAGAGLGSSLKPQGLTGYFIAGQSPLNKRGHSVFRTVQMEMTARSAWLDRHLPDTLVAASLSYSRVRQAHSWFGYRDGEGDDNIRAEALSVGLQHEWATARPVKWFGEIGSGPMWSNRRIPAATSRLNFNSHAGIGVVLFSQSRSPLHIGYRFSHISNGGMASRNPGLAVHSVFVGTSMMLRR